MSMKINKKRKSTGSITINDVAKYAGVGAMTVSRVIREPEKVSKNLRVKIEEAINILGYKKNVAASSLASAQKNNFVIIITENYNSDLNDTILAMLHENIVNQGYMVILIESAKYPNKIDLIISLKHYSPNLLLFLNIDETSADIFKRQLNILDLNYLFLDEQSTSTTPLGDLNLQATYCITQSLIQKGYHNIAFLCIQHSEHIFKQRLNGWHKAMLDNHLANHRVVNAIHPGTFSTGAEQLPEILLQWPEVEAIVCSTDELACGVLYECHRRKIKVPQSLAVVGIGNKDCGKVSYPTLTSIELPLVDLGMLLTSKIFSSLNISTEHNLKIDNKIDHKKNIRWRNST